MTTDEEFVLRCNDATCRCTLADNSEDYCLDQPNTVSDRSVAYKCSKCPHVFCKAHAIRWFKSGRVCPVCNTRTGVSPLALNSLSLPIDVHAPVVTRNPLLGHSPMTLAHTLLETFEFRSEQIRVEASKTMIPRKLAQAKISEASREYTKRAEEARVQSQQIQKKYDRVKTHVERLRQAIVQQSQELQQLAELLRRQGIACSKASREASASTKRRRTLRA